MGSFIELMSDIIFDWLEIERDVDGRFGILMVALGFFVVTAWYLITLRSHERVTAFHRRWAIGICVVSGIISIIAGNSYYNSFDRSQTMLMHSAKIEYNEEERCYELIGKDVTSGESYRMEIDEKLVKKIDPDETVFTVTYEGKKNPRVIYLIPFPRTEDTTKPTSP